ncbi:MAG: hypothetical protein K2K76_01175, partial [Muribaculaceae bacterium]|nr:hypothetical protein [Muribaculaceae bacterium]
MKLIWFPESISGTSVSLQQTLPACRLAVETAIVRHGTPLFLPGWSESWSGVTGVGVVIDRLGRHIDPRFAHRYYSHIVIAVKARPDDEKYLAPEYADAVFSHDGSILVSKPIELGEIAVIEPALDFGNIEELTGKLDKAVAAASRAFTLHTGDVVIAGE